MEFQNRLITAKETSSVLGISLSKCYQLLHTEGFPTVMIGSSLRVNYSELMDWIDKNTGKEN